MNRKVPVQNKIVHYRMREREDALNEQKLREINGLVDQKRPDAYVHGSVQHRKKAHIMEVKHTEIERENRILLEKITRIMNNPTKLSITGSNKVHQTSIEPSIEPMSQQELHEHQQEVIAPSIMMTHGMKPKRSLNEPARRREKLEIMEQNRRMLEKIKSSKSNYNHKKQQDDYMRHEQLKYQISEFANMGSYAGAAGFTGSSATTTITQGRNSPGRSVQGLQSCPPSITHQSSSSNYRNQNFDVSPNRRNSNPKRQNSMSQLEQPGGGAGRSQYKKNASQQRTMRSDASATHANRSSINSQNSNQTDAGANGIGTAPKVILYQQHTQVTGKIFLIEISISKGLFRITAEGSEEMMTRVLELSEADGLKLLRVYFGNEVTRLVSSLSITDRIFINGLIEPTEHSNHGLMNNPSQQNQLFQQQQQQQQSLNRKNQQQQSTHLPAINNNNYHNSHAPLREVSVNAADRRNNQSKTTTSLASAASKKDSSSVAHNYEGEEAAIEDQNSLRSNPQRKRNHSTHSPSTNGLSSRYNLGGGVGGGTASLTAEKQVSRVNKSLNNHPRNEELDN